jgi:hypothetical protein
VAKAVKERLSSLEHDASGNEEALA